MMMKTADKTSLRKRAAALLAAAALASALGFGAAFAGDEAGGALEVNDVGVVQADGVVSDDAAAAGKADVAATGASTGSAAVGEATDAAAEASAAEVDGVSSDGVVAQTMAAVYGQNCHDFTTAGPLIVQPSAQEAASPFRSTSAFSAARISTLSDEDGREDEDAGEASAGGLELNKTVTANDDDTYTITLEAFATGESVTTYVKDGVDIVLMLDLSDYMYGTKTETITIPAQYQAVDSNTRLKDLSNNTTYYCRSEDTYYQVTITRSEGGSGPNNKGASYTITYYNDGTKTLVDKEKGERKLGELKDTTLYTLTRAESTATTTTTDKSDDSKLNALQTAVRNFVDKVHDEAPASRIAIVTYADSATVESGAKTVSEDALVTVNDAGQTALKGIVENLTIRGGASNSHYAAADAVKIFQGVSSDSDEYSRQRVAILFSAGVPGTGWATESKSTLTTGNSVAQATMTQAHILKGKKGEAVSVDTGANVDGGAAWSAFSETDIYGNTEYTGCGATVYCVGLDIPTSGDPAEVYMGEDPYKAGALANEYFWRTSSHRLNGTHITDPGDLGTDGQSVFNDRLSGTSYGSYYYFYPDSLTRNQTDGYYLTTDSGSGLERLNDIFEGIAGQATTSTSSSTTLGSSSVVKDVIAPQFTVPKKTSDINISTAKCTGVGEDGKLTFEDPASATGVAATIDGDDATVSVTGFDFSENWVGTKTDADGGTTYRGSKLVISFTVKVRDGFLGGNGVYTNGGAGVYESGMATSAVQEFPKPAVNVPIGDITIEAADKNVYLTQIPADEQLKSGVTVKCGGVDITDPSKLEDWQKAYVTIDSRITASTGFKATSDGTYTVTASVSPTSNGDSNTPGTVAEKQTKTETKSIKVFKPELTFKDSEVWYGDTKPAVYSGNKAGEVWKHGETASTDGGVTMLGTAPTLDLTYTPEAAKIKDGKIDSKDDIAVDVSVKIGTTDVTDETSFEHADCTGKTCSVPEGKEFLLHVKTCSLTIEKKAASSTTFADGDTFVFTVTGPDGFSTQVVIHGARSVTIDGLKVGSYTVTEDKDWSWRYGTTTVEVDDGEAADACARKTCLTSAVASSTVTFTNTKTDDKWLDFSGWCKNLFKSSGVYDGVGVGMVTGDAKPAGSNR